MYFDQPANKNIVSGNNLPVSSVLLHNRYKFLNNDKKVRPYLDLGLGFTTFIYRRITPDVRRVKKSMFAISPGLGFEISRLTLGCQMIFGGKTPTFEGFNIATNKNVSLRSTRSQQIYFTAAYRIF
jgi:hypothetical protein